MKNVRANDTPADRQSLDTHELNERDIGYRNQLEAEEELRAKNSQHQPEESSSGDDGQNGEDGDESNIKDPNADYESSDDDDDEDDEDDDDDEEEEEEEGTSKAAWMNEWSS